MWFTSPTERRTHACTHAHTHTHKRMQIIQSLDAQNKLYRTFKIEILENNMYKDMYKDMDITSPRAKSESKVCIIQDVFEINILYEFKERIKNRKFFRVELLELHANLKRCYFTCCGCVWGFLKKVIFFFL